MLIFVTGVNGQLGHDVMNELEKQGHTGVGSDISEFYRGNADGSAVTKAPYLKLDITDRDQVQSTIEQISPDAVVHCAAWTAVDAAEESANFAKVTAVNAEGTKNIALAVAELNKKRAKKTKLLYISTDYVFNGLGTEPWKPDCKDYAPLNVYGRTKLDGELAVSSLVNSFFIVRIAWVFGKNGKNFIKTMLSVGKTHSEVRVVNDQIGTPTYTLDLSRLLVDMLGSDKYGYYHATNSGTNPSASVPNGDSADAFISWYDFTKEIYRQANLSTKVIPVTTVEYGLSKAKRPFNSRLDKGKLLEAGFKPLPPWKDAVARYLKELED